MPGLSLGDKESALVDPAAVPDVVLAERGAGVIDEPVVAGRVGIVPASAEAGGGVGLLGGNTMAARRSNDEGGDGPDEAVYLSAGVTMLSRV